MYEELYIIDNDQRLKVDLSNPSGITLNFKSNIFEDLSKITCSYTYTFKLPLTANNRRVFDNADDIRADSSKIRLRLKAEYIQNGIPLFSNANLYIESTDTCFNAVMTWDVIDGLQTLKDNDIALHELPNDNTETGFGPFSLNNGESSDNPPSRGDSGIADDGKTVHAFDNLALVLGPDYNCGIPHRKWRMTMDSRYRFPGWFTDYETPPMPVVPVYKLVTMINETFGTHFLLGKHITSENISDLDNQQEVVEVGVIPLISTNLNSVQLAKRVATLSGLKFENINATLSEKAGDATTEARFPDALTFTSITIPTSDYFKVGEFTYSNSGNAGTTRPNVGIMPSVNGITVEVDGHIRAVFTDYYRGGSGGDTPELRIYQRRRSQYRPNVPGYRQTARIFYEWVELATLTGEQDGLNGDFYVYDFNFTMEEMNERLECGPLSSTFATPIIFAFSAKLKDVLEVRPIKVYLVNSSSGKYKFDVVSNLPDISCLTFMKSLYYMIGAFPSTDAEGNIVPIFYTSILDNLRNGNIVDWSNKGTTDVAALPSKTAYVSGDYAQHNLYLMKSDSDESKSDSSSDDADVYYSGRGELSVENQTLSQSKTIIQLPFYAPFNYDKKNPSFDMGQTFKCWTMEKEDGKSVINWVDPKPCLGLIRDRNYYLSTDGGPYEVAGTVMSMIVWNGFANMVGNESYAYLQRIMRKPFVITENLLLNEHDLRHLDYAVPVYLSKYGAYFAIVSITRDSNGISKCELLKLPDEE